jgi:tetratricopeptide (TPR) repeat protein
MNWTNPGSCIFVLAAACLAGAAAAQAPTPQQLFEAGQYDQAIQAIDAARAQGGAGGPADAFLAAHIRLRQNQNDPAKAEFAKLVASPDPIWRQTGESSTALVDGNVDRALELANAAVTAVNDRAAQVAATGAPADPGETSRGFYAVYQQGLVLARREDWAGAFNAFERAATMNPGFAYAHYYAGLAASRIQRADRLGIHFEQFLTIAPNAPEREAVMSIMRTLRGV